MSDYSIPPSQMLWHSKPGQEWLISMPCRGSILPPIISPRLPCLPLDITLFLPPPQHITPLLPHITRLPIQPLYTDTHKVSTTFSWVPYLSRWALVRVVSHYIAYYRSSVKLLIRPNKVGMLKWNTSTGDMVTWIVLTHMEIPSHTAHSTNSKSDHSTNHNTNSKSDHNTNSKLDHSTNSTSDHSSNSKLDHSTNSKLDHSSNSKLDHSSNLHNRLRQHHIILSQENSMVITR